MKVKKIEKINGCDWLEINKFADNDSEVVINLDKDHFIRIEYIDFTNVKNMSMLSVPTIRIYMYDEDKTKFLYEGMYKDNKLTPMVEVKEALEVFDCKKIEVE